MSNLYNIIEALCAQNGITVTDLCKELSLSRSSLSELKVGRTKRLSSSTLENIANYFNVEENYFYRDFSDGVCYECGFNYAFSSNTEYEHEQNHLKWKKAVVRNGFCWNSNYREEVKGKARSRIKRGKNLSVQEYANQYILVFRALFSRSVEKSDYGDSHIGFGEYCGALLSQKQYKDNIPKDVYKLLTEMFKPNNYIPQGTYYGLDGDIHEEADNYRNSVNLTSNERRILELFKLISPTEQGVLIGRAEMMAEAHQNSYREKEA